MRTGQHHDQHTTRNLKRAKYGFNYGSALYTRLRGAVGGSSTTVPLSGSLYSEKLPHSTGSAALVPLTKTCESGDAGTRARPHSDGTYLCRARVWHSGSGTHSAVRNAVAPVLTFRDETSTTP